MNVLVFAGACTPMDCSCATARDAFPGARIWGESLVEIALGKLLSHEIDLSIVGMPLPGAPGIELIRAAKNETKGSAPPCIVITDLTGPEHLFAAIAAGADGYLLRSEPEQLLVDHLRKLRLGFPAFSAPIIRLLVQHFAHYLGAPRRTARGNEALSRRERDVLHLIARGHRIQDVANQLCISSHTVGSHLKSIYRKLGVSSRAEVALEAQRLGLI